MSCAAGATGRQTILADDPPAREKPGGIIASTLQSEIDPQTGAVAITRYSSVDDRGQPINPLIAHGQVHGGIVQGAGQALSEGVAL